MIVFTVVRDYYLCCTLTKRNTDCDCVYCTYSTVSYILSNNNSCSMKYLFTCH